MGDDRERGGIRKGEPVAMEGDAGRGGVACDAASRMVEEHVRELRSLNDRTSSVFASLAAVSAAGTSLAARVEGIGSRLTGIDARMGRIEDSVVQTRDEMARRFDLEHADRQGLKSDLQDWFAESREYRARVESSAPTVGLREAFSGRAWAVIGLIVLLAALGLVGLGAFLGPHKTDHVIDGALPINLHRSSGSTSAAPHPTPAPTPPPAAPAP